MKANALMTAPAAPRLTWKLRAKTGMAGATLARGCLLDHAAELQAFLDPDSAQALHVEISDAALTRAATVWRQPEDGD